MEEDIASVSSRVGERTSFLRDLTRPWLLKQVEFDSLHRVVPFQKFLGVQSGPDHKIQELWQNPTYPLWKRVAFFILTAYLHIGVFFGEEPFYITAFPFIAWNIDTSLCRRVVIVWALSMIGGQALKDHMKLPRPAHITKMTVKLDDHRNNEYGFPSTHVMAVTSEAATVVYYTYIQDYAGKNEYPLGFAILCCLPIIMSTFFGRVYYGAHSFVDVVGGFIVSLLFFWAFYIIDEAIEYELVHSSSSLYMPTFVFVAMLLVYPRPSFFSDTVADTATIAGVACGVCTAAFFQTRWEFPLVPFPWVEANFAVWLGMAFLRSLVGFVIVAIVRLVGNIIFKALIIGILPASKIPNDKRYEVVIPKKFLVYTMVGFSTCALVPLILSNSFFQIN